MRRGQVESRRRYSGRVRVYRACRGETGEHTHGFHHTNRAGREGGGGGDGEALVGRTDDETATTTITITTNTTVATSPRTLLFSRGITGCSALVGWGWGVERGAVRESQRLA